MGHGSAVVYKLRSESAFKASAGDRLYFPSGSVRILVQLFIAAISPVDPFESQKVSWHSTRVDPLLFSRRRRPPK